MLQGSVKMNLKFASEVCGPIGEVDQILQQ